MRSPHKNQVHPSFTISTFGRPRNLRVLHVILYWLLAFGSPYYCRNLRVSISRPSCSSASSVGGRLIPSSPLVTRLHGIRVWSHLKQPTNSWERIMSKDRSLNKPFPRRPVPPRHRLPHRTVPRCSQLRTQRGVNPERMESITTNYCTRTVPAIPSRHTWLIALPSQQYIALQTRRTRTRSEACHFQNERQFPRAHQGLALG